MGILPSSDFGLQTFSAFGSARGLPVKTAALGRAISYSNPFCYRGPHASLLRFSLIADCHRVRCLRQGEIPASWPHPPDHRGEKWAEKTLRKLSLEEKIGQLFMIWVRAEFLNMNS